MQNLPRTSPAVTSDNKVIIQFKNTGDAPILMTTKFRLPAYAKLSAAAQHLRRLLDLTDSEALFLYCQCAFAPSPDELLCDVAECFADKKGVLLMNYATSPAWG